MTTPERVGVSFDSPSNTAKEQSLPREVLKESLKEQFRRSATILIGNQDPKSKLFPAATRERFVGKDHYDHSWVRDGALITGALLDPNLVKIGEDDLVGRGRKVAVDSIRSSLKLFAKDPWKNAFNQEVVIENDEYGRSCAKLSKDAPPVHFKIDGADCEWPTQNQPDSWGNFLISVGQAVNQGAIVLSEEEKSTIENIADYLVRIRVEDLQQHSMWEWGRVYRPVPTSTLALCSKGLGMVKNIVGKSKEEKIRKASEKLGETALSQYPEEFTVQKGHGSRTDLATMVALHAKALDGVSLVEFFNIADQELGNGEFPGKRRFYGDHYYNYKIDGEMFAREAIWPMGDLYEANICFEEFSEMKDSGEIESAERFKERGLRSIEKIMDLVNIHGFNPELLQNTEKGFVPNGNHLLWNEALMLQACSRALLLV